MILVLRTIFIIYFFLDLVVIDIMSIVGLFLFLSLIIIIWALNYFSLIVGEFSTERKLGLNVKWLKNDV